MSLRAEKLSASAGAAALVREVDLELRPGELHAVLGPNGAGKSSLLKLLAGDLAPCAGRVDLNGRALNAWTPRQRARQRAVLPQSDSLRFGFSVEQVVALGRLPCPQHAPAREREIVMAALEAAGVAALHARRYPTLSGGERARVQLARVMAQLWEPLGADLDHGARYLLLDEPTASLDLAHQHQCLAMARCFAAGGVGVLAILHDPNLAMRYADRVSLIAGGRVVGSGTPEQALTAAAIRDLYGVSASLTRVEGLARPLIVVSRPDRSAAGTAAGAAAAADTAPPAAPDGPDCRR